MTCEELIPFIDAYVDQELDDSDLRDMEVHLEECQACRGRVAYQVSFKDHFKQVMSATVAPAEFKQNLMAQLAAVDAERHVEPVVEPAPAAAVLAPTRSRGQWLRHAWVAAPLAAALGLVVVVPNFTVAPASSDVLPVVEQTVDWHSGNFPIEVTGPDAQGVTRWFRDKVDFPVRLPHFDHQRATLLGARLAHVQDRRAAYVVYEVDGTRLSVMMFDGQGLTVPSDRIRTVGSRDMMVVNQRGYEVAMLQDDGVTYTITSELPEPQFLSLVAGSVE